MRSDVGQPWVVGGLVLLVVLTCCAWTPFRTEAEADVDSAPNGDPETPSNSCTPPGLDGLPGIAEAVPTADPGRDRCDDRWMPHLSWMIPNRAEVTVDTHVEPGSPLKQTARITNSGNVPLIGLVAELEVGSCTQGIGPLEPGRTTTVSCSGAVPQTSRATARAFGMSVLGLPASAADEVEIEPPRPARASIVLTIGAARPLSGNGSAELPVRVTNPSPVALLDAEVTGTPRECARSFGRVEPGQSFAYDCRARPGSAVELAVSARTEGGSIQEGAVVTASAHAFVPPPAPPFMEIPPAPPVPRAPVPAEPVQPEPPAGEPPPRETPDRAEGPLDSPARTAGFVSIAAVLVMLVSVGALSTATRPGK